MNKVRRAFFGLVLFLCLILGGCGTTENLTSELSKLPLDIQESASKMTQMSINEISNLQLELDKKNEEKENDLTLDIENEAKENLDNWLGKYTFLEVCDEEGRAFMFMDYNINIYKEDNQYYADVDIDGQLTGIDLKTKVYGNEEWISMVIIGYNPGHISGLSQMENTVILSLRKQGEDIYTYWGVMMTLFDKNQVSGIYLKKAEEENIRTENEEEINRLEEWIGKYAFSEELGEEKVRNYDITIYQDNGQYYANLKITGEGTGIDVKTQIYGNEEWISLVLVEYNQGHESGLEEMENEVLLSLRKQGKELYTYWGGWSVTELLNNKNCYVYYDSNEFFKKVEAR